MPANSEPAAAGPEAPQLPAALLEPIPVIAVGVVLWLLATIAAFTVAGLEHWRPICWGGLATGVVGTSVFLWQRSAVRRGAKGAQTGLEFDTPDHPQTKEH